MKKLIWPIGFVLAFAVPTMAQQVQQQEYTFKVNNDELGKIGAGLGKLPYDDVAALIGKLRQQFIDQQPKPETPKEQPKPEEKK